MEKDLQQHIFTMKKLLERFTMQLYLLNPKVIEAQW